MNSIVFLFSYNDSKEKYYGKYICYYMPYFKDEIDEELRPILINGLNEYRKQNGCNILSDDDVNIGILSSSHDCNVYTSKKEIKLFDVYIIYNNHFAVMDETYEYYINGNLLVFS